jgi:hypothetical protein
MTLTAADLCSRFYATLAFLVRPREPCPAPWLPNLLPKGKNIMIRSTLKPRDLVLLTMIVMTNRAVFGGTMPIVVSTEITVGFEGAQSGPPPMGEPLTIAVPNGNSSALLHLGDYSVSDVGQTRTLIRDTAIPGEWDAALAAAQINAESWFWLGLNPAFDPTFFNRHTFPLIGFIGGRPSYNLYEVEVTPNEFRVWTDDGNTYRTANIRLVFNWLVPEPAAWVFVVMAVSLIRLRHSRHSQ